MLIESQIASGEYIIKSLEELFKFTNKYLYFMSEVAPSVPQSSPEGSISSLASTWEQLDGNAAFPGCHITCRLEDEGIVSTADIYLLLLAIDPSEMDSFTLSFLYNNQNVIKF